MAGWPIFIDFDDKRVGVAIGCDGNDVLVITGSLPFKPERIARTAVETA